MTDDKSTELEIHRRDDERVGLGQRIDRSIDRKRISRCFGPYRVGERRRVIVKDEHGKRSSRWFDCDEKALAFISEFSLSFLDDVGALEKRVPVWFRPKTAGST